VSAHRRSSPKRPRKAERDIDAATKRALDDIRRGRVARPDRSWLPRRSCARRSTTPTSDAWSQRRWNEIDLSGLSSGVQSN